MGSIRHPNIVQYLCVTRDPESRLPVLLMELLDESLTKMLKRSQQSLAYCIQVDICHDIALAVAFLHSNDIIHRDLSSNNVLIIAGRRAKVTDFGMSRLAGAAPSTTPLTTCPGTLVYMPPEALREPPRYTKKLDCFSEGVIMIQVCTQLWPEPGPRTQIIQDSRSLTGIMEMPVPETHRRKNHIDLIDPNYALLPIAIDCLQFHEKDRPSSEELCQRLAGLKEDSEYKDDVQNNHDTVQAKDIQIMAQAQQLDEKDRLMQQRADEITSQNQQLQEKDRLLQHREAENASLTQQLQDSNKAILDKDNQLQEQSWLIAMYQEEIASRERQLRQLNQQLEEQEQVTAEIQQTNHSLQRQVEQLSQQSLKPPQPSPPSQAQLQEREPPSKQLLVQPSLQVDHKPHLKWKEGGKAPLEISRGAAVVDGNMAYFMNTNGDICSYNSSSKRWRELPKCPHQHCSLAIINSQVTAIGGIDGHLECTNKLLSLQMRRKEFEEVFPPMPTKRCDTTAVTTKKHLIVAGGETELSDHAITQVEAMDMKTLVWSTVASLPQVRDYASGTVCGDQLYMLGGGDNKRKTKSVLTCSLTELLQPLSSSSIWHVGADAPVCHSTRASLSIWHSAADAPAYCSTCAAVNGELLAVGGCDKDDKPTAAIHKYNPTTNSWDLISNMPTARFLSLITVLPNKMIVVGGKDELCSNLNKVEIAKF